MPRLARRCGVRHAAIFVDAVDDAIAGSNARGFETALCAAMNDDFAVAMIDASKSLGRMIELHKPLPVLTGFCAMVAEAAKNVAGGRLLREMSFT